MKNEEARVAALTLAQHFNPLTVDLLIEMAKPIEQYILGSALPQAKYPEIDLSDISELIEAQKSIAVFATKLKIQDLGNFQHRQSQNGLMPFIPNEDQLAIFDAWENNSKVFLDMDRQKGTTTALMAAILHEAIFKPYRTTVFVAWKLDAAKHYKKILNRMIENLPPRWVDLARMNQLTVELENGSMILFTGPKLDSLRGRTINTLVIDQAGFMSNADVTYLNNNVLPTICGSHSAKLVYATTGYEGDKSNLVTQLREDPKTTKIVRRIG